MSEKLQLNRTKRYKVKLENSIEELEKALGKKPEKIRFSLDDPTGRVDGEDFGRAPIADFSIDIIDGEPKIRAKRPTKNTAKRVMKYIIRKQEQEVPADPEPPKEEEKKEEEPPKEKKKIKFKVKEKPPEEKRRFRSQRPKIDDEELRAKVVERLERIRRKPPVPPKPRRLRDDVYRIPQKGREALLEQIRSRRLDEQPAPPRKSRGERERAVRSDKGKNHLWSDGRNKTETYKRNEGVDWSRVRCRDTTCWETSDRRTDAIGKDAYAKNVRTKHYIKQLRRKKPKLK